MVLERDPNMRRRLDGQEMLGRDQEVARLRELNVPLREIAKRLGCSVGSAQKAVERIKRRRAEAAQDLDDDDDALFPRDVVDDAPPVGAVQFVGVDESGVERFTDDPGRPWDLWSLYRVTRCGAPFLDACRQLEDAGRRPKREKTGPSESW